MKPKLINLIAKLLQGNQRSSKNAKDSKDLSHEEILITLTHSFVCEAEGILGFPRFTDGHYIYFITKSKVVGKLLSSDIHQILEAKLEMVLSEVIFLLKIK